MSAVINPELFASIKLTKGAISISPELYVSLKLSKGEIDIKPQIYATVIPAPKSENIRADTYRVVKKSENVVGDSLRQLGIPDSISADTKKSIQCSQTVIGDTKKILACLHKVIADTLRVLFIPAGAYFTTYIWASIKFAEHKETIHADTLIQKYLLDVTQGDTLKQISNSQTVHADTLLKLVVKPKVIADTLVRRTLSDTVKADTLREIVQNETITADSLIRNVDRARADTLRIIKNIVTVRADTVIRVPHILKYVVENNPVTLRGVKSLRATPAYSLVNSFKDYGVTSINISLNERTLSDNFQFDITQPMEINDAVRGQLLDYEFNFLVEETNQQDFIQSVKGMYDCDKQLYTTIYTDKIFSDSTILDVTTTSRHTARESVYAKKASSESTSDRWQTTKYIEKIAKHFGLSTNMLFDDFIHTSNLLDSNITYRDLINQLFSWTTQLPQRQINVFIRGKTLHCIQRGKETSTFDISDLPHSRPVKNKKLIRTLWNNPNNSSSSNSISSASSDSDGSILTPINYPEKEKEPEDPIVEYMEDEEEYYEPYTGTIGYQDKNTTVWIRYSSGLVDEDFNQLQNSSVKATSKTSYDYISYDDEEYLSGKETTNTTERKNDVGNIEIVKVATTIRNKYYYASEGGIYLGSETENKLTETKEYTADKTKLIYTETDTSIRQTFHTPVGNGWYAQSVYVDGEAQGSNLSQGKPGNKISPYTIKQVRKIFGRLTKQYIPPKAQGGKDSGSGTGGGDSGSGSGTGGGDSGSGSGSVDADDWRNSLSPIDDTTFPVLGYELLRELSDALLWLNRKIQEDVSVDLILRVENGVPSINHIVDFTERIILDGNEYFLVSNQISFTPRKFIQKLKLIRWYAQ